MTWILAIAAVGCAYMAWRWTMAAGVFFAAMKGQKWGSKSHNILKVNMAMYFWGAVAAFAAALCLAFASGFTMAGGW